MERILHVIGMMNRAGAETFIMNLYKAIDRNRFQFDFMVSAQDTCDYDHEIERMGGRIFRVPMFAGANLCQYKAAVVNILEQHPENHVIHGHIGSSASIYLHEAKRRGRYAIAHSHATYGPPDIVQMAYRAASFPTRYIADHFFACSYEAGLDRYGKRVVSDKHRFNVIKNGIALDIFSHSYDEHMLWKRELWNTEGPVFGHVGRFESVKNHAFLLKVFQQIKAREPSALLVLIGTGTLRSEIEQQANLLGLRDSIVFAGLIPDVQDVLFTLDAFIFPSLYEGFGIALLEAQAAGLPCVIADTVSGLAIATDYVTALPLNLGPDRWAESCLEATTKRERAAEENSQRLVTQGFDIQTTARELETFYDLAISELSCR